MTRTKMVLGSVLIIAAFMLYGNITKGPDGKPDTDDDNERQISFEVEAHPPPGRTSSFVGIVAQLGSAGNYEKANARIYSATDTETRMFRHTFRAKVGDRLSATVTSNEGPLFDFNCYFFQKGFRGLPNTVPNDDRWGDISAPIGAGQPREVARCTATVK